ncbi:MAG TPA: 6,7-dimethyl-8-ribityllumazine synthase [Armatimonadetes bacterium]|nr:6,7-dimethyl-8-ribityllumazine synthase [Armatimonadota bacterium]
MAHKVFEGQLDARGLRFALIVSRFNSFVTERLLSGALDALQRTGAAESGIEIVRVPGSWEMPAAASALARQKRFDAIICLGAVIRGETYHFELVSNEMGAGITRVGLDLGLPIANGVLTTDTDEQALARMSEKGRDCARAAVEMANLCKAIR